MTSTSPGWARRVFGSRVLWLLVGALAPLLAFSARQVLRDRAAEAQRPYLNLEQKLPRVPLVVKESWIQEGQPKFTSNVYATTPDGKTMTGIWACEGPTRFVWTFDIDETFHILEGEVEIESRGKTFVLGPGSTAFFPAGSIARWKVDKWLLKSFTIHEPGSAVRLARRLVPLPERVVPKD